MTKYVVDSSCDLFTYENIQMEAVPLTIYTDDICYTDDDRLDVFEMIQDLEKYKGRSYTACPGVESWLNAFLGGDKIYVVTLTGTLSGTYNSALVAKDIYLQENPDTQIEVFDSLSTGPEMRLIAEKIMELDQSGLPFEQVCNKVRSYMKHTHLFFAFQSLHNFAQNGRISKVLESMVGILGISILGTASDEGTISPINKFRGEKKVINGVVDALSNVGYKGGKVRISHIMNLPLAEKISTAIKNRFQNAIIDIYPARGICSYYGERGGIIIGCETLD